MDLNSVQLGGRLTSDPELRKTKSGHSVCDVSVAINRMKEGETDFVDVTLWGKTAELAATHLAKGRFINVLGRLQQDKWQDKDGNNRYSLNVVADNLYFGPKTGNGTPSTPKKETKQEAVSVAETEDVPF
mgnify:CR=1 FL=1|tara:strand:- start:6145 stop:6534 length:390 start_codon:yes stop_codon:yes gene_type:complete